jgi:hypothetical protein
MKTARDGIRAHRGVTTMTTDDDEFYVFPIASGAWQDANVSPEVAKLWQEHEAEADRKGVEFFNYGWSTADDGICSKTSAGYLETSILPGGQIVHRWQPYGRSGWAHHGSRVGHGSRGA